MEFQRDKLKMNAGSFYIPKDNNPSKPLGEDAHFVLNTKQVFGVFDGVGGWAKRGIDAGIYSRQLAEKSQDAIFDDGPYATVDPKRVLELAFFDADADGSSTACIITLSGNVLRAVNLGDSGFVVVRNGKIVYKSPVQQRGFNCPYQMGRAPGADDPHKAEELEVEVEAGDVVIAGTDGLFDNVFLEEIERVVREWLVEITWPDVLACALALMARLKSVEKGVRSPFEVAAREAGVKHVGGKYDDITVVAAHICCN